MYVLQEVIEMNYHYNYETFSADSSEFDHKFTDYLNRKGADRWRVKHCSYCHDSDNTKMHAACMFERDA
jgi:hypothetical protein